MDLFILIQRWQGKCYRLLQQNQQGQYFRGDFGERRIYNNIEDSMEAVVESQIYIN
jgi:hypothetical protein